MKRVVTLVLMAAALVVPATASEATTGAASAADVQVRFAWVKGCPKKEDIVPCGPWTLTLRSGKKRVLKDALVYATTAEGKVDKTSATTFAISRNGKVVCYFRKSDHKLVVRNLVTGKVRALPGKAAVLPKGNGMTLTHIYLSYDGAKVLIDYNDDADTQPTLVVDLATGATHKLRGDLRALGFSPDGDQVLVQRFTEHTTEFAVYDETGAKVNSQVVPGNVAGIPIALSGDGRTVGVITNAKDRQRLRLYDLTSDTASDPVTLKVPKIENVTRLFFDPSGNLVIWSLRGYKGNEMIGVLERRVDPVSGATTKIDTFTFDPAFSTWLLPGE
ncbi:hypothetical protein J5X84_27450 [Streptosporangiaceae bacterium NEAU-GS5]|nr:hypothetical protein [Streptosporangiaceae bacterium NEAU-GS5]